MKNNQIKSKSRTSILAAILISTVFVVFYLFNIQQDIVVEKEENAVLYAESVISVINMSMDKYVYTTEVMEHAYLQDSELFFSRFESYGAWLVHNSDAITTAYFTDKGVLTHGYPEQVTEDIVKVDLFELEGQKEKALLARDTGNTIIAGPLTVLEGYRGLIIRNPVYENDEFVGFSIVVLNSEIYEKELVSHLTKLDQYKIGIRKENSEPVEILEDGYFFTTGNIEDTRVEVPFTIANEQMYLVVDRHDGWLTVEEMMLHLWTAFLLVTIICLLVFFISRSEERREQLRMERAASDAMSSFLSSMSHDMRTPLNGIIGLLDISIKHPEDQELVYENNCKAFATSKHLLALINNVLDMNKIASGVMDMENVSFRMASVLKECTDMLRVQAEAEGLKIHLENLDDCRKPIMGSPLHLKEVIINIFGNAIKYNKKNGEIFATARCQQKDDGNVVYVLSVRDTGIGMTQEFIEKNLFKPFVQGEKSSRVNVVGTGLGMPIVKDLVEKMNGVIEVESEVNVGTTITVTLPFAIDTEDAETNSEAEEAENLSGWNILLVDDVELNVEIAQFVLEEVGAKVTIARDGKEAIAVFENSPVHSFDVILMDVIMPVMNGYEATREIRSMDREDAQNIPIIALTANAFKEDMDKCLEAGMTAHIAKPIEASVLIRKIRRMNIQK